MNTITKLLVPLLICFALSITNAQEVKKDSLHKTSETIKENRIKDLEAFKARVETQERALLKQKIEIINKRLDANEISAEDAQSLKAEAAKFHAENIENRLTIIDNKIALIRRNDNDFNYSESEDRVSLSIGNKGVKIDLSKPGKNKPPKYDIRTGNKLLFAMGLNNALIDGQSLSDSPYKLGGSGFVELGWIWETRLLKDSHFARINYGFSFQWNKLNIKDDNYLVQNDNVTTLQGFPGNLKKAKFRTSNLVIPVHFEFGPYKKKEYENRIRYHTRDQFKIGIGGYGGVRLGTMQKLRYIEDGNTIKNKERRNFNASNFVYGLSGYVGIGDISLYCKYDLNPLFDNQAVKQNNISFGVRIDLD